MKNSITQMKNSVAGLSSRVHKIEDSVFGLDEKENELQNADTDRKRSTNRTRHLRHH
jgi:hypothetical protein